MSVSKWAYTPEMCDGEYCVGDCDLCSKVATIKELMNAGRKYIYKDRTGEYINCIECKYSGMPWYELPCDACCPSHSGFERREA